MATATETFKSIVRDIRNRALEPEEDYDFKLPMLFRIVSLTYSLPALEVLEEWLTDDEDDDSTDPRKKVRAVAKLMEAAPEDFLFTNVDFVRRFLHRAHGLGPEVYSSARYYLRRSTTAGTTHSLLGEPAPRDLRIKDGASRIAARLPDPSLERDFYLSLVAEAERRVKDTVEEHASLLEDELD